MTAQPPHPLHIHVVTFGSDGTTEISQDGPSLITGVPAVPRAGEHVLYARNWWTVRRIFWAMPDEAARAPAMMAILHVAKLDPQPPGHTATW